MFFIFGQRNFGKCDRVPGVFYVVTQFFHINFVPLIPTSTYLVLEGSESGNSFKGKKISMSGKSILIAWGRWALIISLLICAAVGFFTLVGGAGQADLPMLATGMFMGMLAVACGVLFWSTYHFSKASHDRAMQLADEIGLSQAFVAKCLDPNRGPGDMNDMLQAEPVRRDERDYDDRRDRDYNRDRDYDDDRDRDRDRDRDYDDRRDRDYDRRERDYDRREPDRDYDRRDY
jgi:hypothetical protein